MPLDRIAIIGGGLAGWMAASVLARQLSGIRCRIEVVESGASDESIGPMLPTIATLPSVQPFHARFGYDENDIIAQTSGCFSLGAAISGWASSGKTCFFPYGDTGAAMGHVAFHHLVARLRADGLPVSLPDYSLAALCAQTNRFARPMPGCETVMSTLDYGLIVDALEYTDYFRRDARANAVTHKFARPQQIQLDAVGNIQTVVLDDGSSCAADLFIDCTGPQAHLISALPDVRFEDWSHWLPFDAMASTQEKTDDAPPPYVHLISDDTGWRRLTSTRTMTSETLLISKELNQYPLADVAYVQPGRRSTFWSRNCIALGAAAATLDPLSPLTLHMLQSAIGKLVSLLPNNKSSTIEPRQFNRQMSQEFECARDFAILPYKISGRSNSTLWNQCRNMEIPDSLAYKIALYEATGRVAQYDGEPQDEADWVALFDAQDIRPRRYDPAANGLLVSDIRSHLARIREIMVREVATMPFHRDYLKGFAR
jgi:tryptophan 7-halogenase